MKFAQISITIATLLLGFISYPSYSADLKGFRDLSFGMPYGAATEVMEKACSASIVLDRRGTILGNYCFTVGDVKRHMVLEMEPRSDGMFLATITVLLGEFQQDALLQIDEEIGKQYERNSYFDEKGKQLPDKRSSVLDYVLYEDGQVMLGRYSFRGADFNAVTYMSRATAAESFGGELKASDF